MLQRRFAEELRQNPTLPLRVGAGIDAGEAVAVEGGYRGGALNLAARLCSLAKAGEVLVGEGAVLLARRVPEVEYLPRGKVTLKGFSEPVRYYQARFPLDLPPEEPESGSGLWTRRRITAALLVVLAATAAGLGFGLTREGSRVRPANENALLALDPGGGKIVAQRSMSSPPGGLAVGEDGVWATDPAGGRLVSLLADGSAGAVAGTGGGVPTAVTTTPGTVWAVDADRSSVAKVDAKLLTPVDRIRVGAGPTALAGGGGSIWVANADDGTVQRIDARSDRAGDPISVGSEPVALALGLGTVWVVDAGNGTLVQINPRTSSIAAITPVGAGPDAVVVDDGKVWVANGPENTVTRFDPQNPAAQRKVTIPAEPTTLASGGDAVWVGTVGGDIYHLDTRTLRLALVRRLGVPLGGLVSNDGRLWATTLARPAEHAGGTLRVASSQPLDSVDPATAFETESWLALTLTNDGLVGFRRVSGAAGTLLLPDLATAIPAPTDGGKTYRFVLRKGIRYSTGAPVRPSDFPHALARALSEPNGPARFFLSKLVGATDCRPRRCDLSRGVVADDAAGTVTFHLTSPDPALPELLALPFAFPLPSSVQAPAPDTPVPATGPYRVSRLSLQHGLVLVRNSRFHVWSTQAQPRAFPDRIVWRLRVDPAREVDQVERNELDLALHAWLSPQAKDLTTSYPRQVHEQTRAATYAWFMNTRVPPFDDVRVRRALNYAIDRRRAARAFGGIGIAFSCQVLPPGITGFRPYCPYGRHGVPGSGYKGPQLSRARRLVATSGTKGAPVTVVSSNTATQANKYLVHVLDSLGYQARQRVVGDTGAYFAYVADSRHRAQIGFFGYIADYPAPSDFVDHLFNCGSWAPGDPGLTINPSLFCDPRVERALAVARRLQAADPGRAPLAWSKVDRLVTNEAPWAVLGTPRALYFLSKRVSDYQYNPQWGPLLSQLRVR
jgi:ABC-type transport system substrate-binding protein/streptogramin lyase